jgi:hypothetical protein
LESREWSFPTCSSEPPVTNPPAPPPDAPPDRIQRLPLSLEQLLRAELGVDATQDPESMGGLLQTLSGEVAGLSRELYEGGPAEVARLFSREAVEGRLPGSRYRPLVDELDIPPDEELPCVGWFAAIYSREPAPGLPDGGIQAALAAVFGAQTRILLSVGRGTHLLRMQGGTGEFVLEQPRLTIPGNGRRGGAAIPAIPLAPGLLRILRKGGRMGPVAAHPLRRAAPAAFLVEQAGGAGTDGIRRVLDVAATSPEASLPLFLGSGVDVPGAGTGPWEGSRSATRDAEDAPLFGHRGLFRP